MAVRPQAATASKTATDAKRCIGSRAIPFRAKDTRPRCHGLHRAFAEIRQERPPDLVCLTGDVADWGADAEYEAATKLLDGLLDSVGATWDQLLVVPGNHERPNRWSGAEPAGEVAVRLVADAR